MSGFIGVVDKPKEIREVVRQITTNGLVRFMV